jgi:hypothetical protein
VLHREKEALRLEFPLHQKDGKIISKCLRSSFSTRQYQLEELSAFYLLSLLISIEKDKPENFFLPLPSGQHLKQKLFPYPGLQLK